MITLTDRHPPKIRRGCSCEICRATKAENARKHRALRPRPARLHESGDPAHRWTEMPGEPGYYVSILGLVCGPSNRLLSPEVVKGGYLRVKFRSRRWLTHRAVVTAFIGPIPDGLEVNHKNGDKTDNRLENLEIVTPSENVKHSITVLHTERAPGEKNANAKLTDQSVLEIRDRYAQGEDPSALAVFYGLTRGHIWRVATRQAWRHI